MSKLPLQTLPDYFMEKSMFASVSYPAQLISRPRDSHQFPPFLRPLLSSCSSSPPVLISVTLSRPPCRFLHRALNPISLQTPKFNNQSLSFAAFVPQFTFNSFFIPTGIQLNDPIRLAAMHHLQQNTKIICISYWWRSQSQKASTTSETKNTKKNTLKRQSTHPNVDRERCCLTSLIEW